jgi:ABC-type cobalt transport system substrate-binding protein
LLFALQAAIGASVIGYFLGFKRGTQRMLTSGAIDDTNVVHEDN